MKLLLNLKLFGLCTVLALAISQVKRSLAPYLVMDDALLPNDVPQRLTSPCRHRRLHGKSTATTTTATSRSRSRTSPTDCGKLVVDVLSIGSQARWGFFMTQVRNPTWGSHPSIRSFEGVNESHHELYEGMSCQNPNIMEEVKDCNNLTNYPRPRDYYFVPEHKNGEFWNYKGVGWMCAQRRPVIGLHSIYAQQYRQGGVHELPDWFLLVDDDTLFRMNVFEIAVSHLNPDTHAIFVGLDIMLGWPYGGFGLALSRAAVRRLFSPIYCNQTTTSGSGGGGGESTVRGGANLESRDFYEFSQAICHTVLPKNKIFEQEEFRDGMSVLDLMLAIQLQRKPFCWHSDWQTGWFFTNYLNLGKKLTTFPECPQPYDCSLSERVEKEIPICSSTTLVCHDYGGLGIRFTG